MNALRIIRLLSMILLAVLIMQTTLVAQRRLSVLGPQGSWETRTITPNEKVKLRPGQQLAVLQTGQVVAQAQPSSTIPEQLAGKQLLSIPETYHARRRDTQQEVVLNVRLIPDRPLRFDRKTGFFHGSLLVFLEEPGQNQPRMLSHPVPFSIASRADSVAPRQDSIDHSNMPPREIRFAWENPRDSLEARFLTAINLEGYKVMLPVEPTLRLEVTDTVVQAFGIDNSTVIISRIPSGSGQEHSIDLAASEGAVDPPRVTLERGQATTLIRSGWIGQAKVTATSPDFPQVEVALSYVFPTRFLLATLVGGLVGSILRKSNPKGGIAGKLGVGFLVGLVVAVAWAGVGLNLLALALPAFVNEAVVFVVSALGAFAGTGVLPQAKAQDAG